MLDVCGIAHGGVFGCCCGGAKVVVHDLLLNARFVRRSDNGGNMGAPTEYREEAAELVHAGAYGPQLLEDLQHRLFNGALVPMCHRGVTVVRLSCDCSEPQTSSRGGRGAPP